MMGAEDLSRYHTLLYTHIPAYFLAVAWRPTDDPFLYDRDTSSRFLFLSNPKLRFLCGTMIGAGWFRWRV